MQQNYPLTPFNLGDLNFEIMLGHWIEMKSLLEASRSLHRLVEMMPSKAHLLKDGQAEDVKVGQQNKDDTVVLRPGKKFRSAASLQRGKAMSTSIWLPVIPNL